MELSVCCRVLVRLCLLRSGRSTARRARASPEARNCGQLGDSWLYHSTEVEGVKQIGAHRERAGVPFGWTGPDEAVV